ncbi:hypothetical protein Agabi119p4_11219 [Agaricus bisporus var. burnettii]|uniref:Uncharacterized protein n=1 Tax=Agaricus bisporus var. burnettii TaxID=192524 RepID=A0A8H7C1L7_AGABI|nr:hypothetical protein Agabi119p4_11219 [Agaricus bisporus var. burnettii]
MQRSTSTQESIVVLQRENEAKILKFLQKSVGPPPAASLCSKHPLKSKKLCTSQSDAQLTNAGRWFSFCKPCDRLYFSNRTIHVGDLIVNNAEFRALIERRRALSPKPRPSQKRESATLAPPMGSRPVVKAFILWTEAGKSPTLISFFCESTKPIRLVDYRKTLEENGAGMAGLLRFSTPHKRLGCISDASAKCPNLI